MGINDFKIWHLLRRDISHEDIEAIAYMDWGYGVSEPYSNNPEAYWRSSAESNIRLIKQIVKNGKYIREIGKDDCGDPQEVCLLSAYDKENILVSCFGSFLTIEFFSDDSKMKQEKLCDMLSGSAELVLSALQLGYEYQAAILEYLIYYASKIERVSLKDSAFSPKSIAHIFLLLSIVQREIGEIESALNSFKKGCKAIYISAFLKNLHRVICQTGYDFPLALWLGEQTSLRQVIENINQHYWEMFGISFIENENFFIVPSPSQKLNYLLKTEKPTYFPRFDREEDESLDLRDISWLKAKVNIEEF